MPSVVDTTVHNFNSTMAAAPVLNGTAGSLVALLDACLVTGFDLKTATSLVVASGVATLSFSGTHSAAVDSVIFVENASNGALNGEQRVTSVAAGVVRFATAAADGTATGAITFKMAPAGWAKSFAGTNLAVYRSTDVASTGAFLRVDDNSTTNARVRAYETMSDASTGQGSVPLDDQCAGGLFWGKSSAADSTARPWFIFADGRGIYFCAAPNLSEPNSFTGCYAGDFKSRKSGDAYGFVLAGNQSDLTASYSTNGCIGYSNRNTSQIGIYVMRSQTFLGGSIAATRIGAHHNGPNSDAYAGSDGYSFGAYPNAAGNELLTAELEINTNCLRGTFPGLLHPVQDMAGSFSSGQTVDGTDAYVGRRLIAVRVGRPPTPPIGTVFFDCRGPWRA